MQTQAAAEIQQAGRSQRRQLAQQQLGERGACTEKHGCGECEKGITLDRVINHVSGYASAPWDRQCPHKWRLMDMAMLVLCTAVRF